MTEVSTERRGSIAVITIDNPPVNALSQAVRSGLMTAIDQADGDDRINAIVIVCHGRTFVAGADIREFDKPPMRPYATEFIARIESCEKPVVAGLHGTALGGGLETALGCHYRIALTSARVGLPEVTLGLLPGAGGTQRLPRLAGIPKALDIMISGKPVSANEAHDAEVQALIAREAESLNIEQREIDDQEIVERCIIALIVEGARILEDGISPRPGDIDVVWTSGYGFPRHRGGPMHCADTISVDRVYATVCEYRERFGPMYWEVPELLKDLATSGRRFADL